MIWVFKLDEVFWGNKPKVNEHYLFNVNDVNFDMTIYDISLYFATSLYFLLNEDDKKIYYLNYQGSKNPSRITIEEGSYTDYIQTIIDYYNSNEVIKSQIREYKINQIFELGTQSHINYKSI